MDNKAMESASFDINWYIGGYLPGTLTLYAGSNRKNIILASEAAKSVSSGRNVLYLVTSEKTRYALARVVSVLTGKGQRELHSLSEGELAGKLSGYPGRLSVFQVDATRGMEQLPKVGNPDMVIAEGIDLMAAITAYDIKRLCMSTDAAGIATVEVGCRESMRVLNPMWTRWSDAVVSCWEDENSRLFGMTGHQILKNTFGSERVMFLSKTDPSTGWRSPTKCEMQEYTSYMVELETAVIHTQKPKASKKQTADDMETVGDYL